MKDTFLMLREKYPEFVYQDFVVEENDIEYKVTYTFKLNELVFKPVIKISKDDISNSNIDKEYLNYLFFQYGLFDLMSYYKLTCSPKIIIKCGHLNDEQISWWKKIYFYGLGEMFYTNNIHTTIQDFVEIECTGEEISFESDNNEDAFNGYIAPIGGGKDSVVTLETLPLNRKKDFCLIVNPKPVTLKCAEIAGFEYDNIIEIYRNIDKNLIELNKKGFINGHTPFSAMLAFLSYFTAYMLSKKYIALSNENSANESNVVGEKINHQYSKSFEFECDFENYSNKYLKTPVKYFSFLRPLNELQIAKLFSKHEKYHSTFKSCNVGSKGEEWRWCCNCPKCLFAYTILSPFLYKEKLVNIFGMDLFENKELLNTFLELTGNGETKPFECVGTYEEVNFAISQTIENIEKKNKPLPFLLQYFKDNYDLVDTNNDITLRYNDENNLNEEQNAILKKEVFSNDN